MTIAYLSPCPCSLATRYRIRRLDTGAPVAGLALERRPEHAPSMPELDEDDLTPAARGLYILRAGGVLLHVLAVERAWCERNLYLPTTIATRDSGDNPVRRPVPGDWLSLRSAVMHATVAELLHYERTGERPASWPQGQINPSGRSSSR